MLPTLYAHPFSSYCWKALIAFWENDTQFEYRHVEDPAVSKVWKEISPMERMPLLVVGDQIIPETTIIIEYAQQHFGGAVPMIPVDPSAALQVRLLDRMSDNYLMAPTQIIVFDRAREESQRDALGVDKARAQLEKAYSWWNQHLTNRIWAHESFGLADCAAAPALFYSDWVQPISADFRALRDYRERLLRRPSVARAVNEARPFRALFPFGDPGRD